MEKARKLRSLRDHEHGEMWISKDDLLYLLRSGQLAGDSHTQHVLDRLAHLIDDATPSIVPGPFDY